MRFYQISALVFIFFLLFSVDATAGKRPRKWLCVYHHIPVEKLLATGAELMVLEPDAYSREEITLLRENNIRVLGYISVGEAESYRYFFKKVKDAQLLMQENPDWPENFAVKYWSPIWLATLLDYSSKILNKGFNGLFVDVVDAWQLAPEPQQLLRKEQMENLLLKIAKNLHDIDCDNWLFIQNSHQLLDNPDLLKATAGINQESLYASWAEPEVNPEWQKEKIRALETIRRQGKLVTLLEYTRDPIGMARIRMKASMHGFLPYFSVRELDRVFRDQP